jgi:hypothetical protein
MLYMLCQDRAAFRLGGRDVDLPAHILTLIVNTPASRANPLKKQRFESTAPRVSRIPRLCAQTDMTPQTAQYVAGRELSS